MRVTEVAQYSYMTFVGFSATVLQLAGCLPFTYLLCGTCCCCCHCFQRVIDMEPGSPRFTELFHYTLLRFLLGNSPLNLLFILGTSTGNIGEDDDRWPSLLACLA
jgi:hypothetical protein